MEHEFQPEHQELWLRLSEVLSVFGKIQDRLDPAKLSEYAALLAPAAQALGALLEPEHSSPLKANPESSVLLRSASQVLQAASRFAAATGPEAMLKAYQALRPLARAEEILYELSGSVDSVSRYFLTASYRDDLELIASLRDSTAHRGSGPPRGVISHHNERGKRGGYSLYVPEYYSPDRRWPLVVALHGGSGHGADFLWSWVADARSSGFLLASPSSLDRTWSLRQVAADAGQLNSMLSRISESYNVDPDRILLTGISDGGTYAMLLSIVHQSPFTHFAPVAAAVHVLLTREGAIAAPVQGLRIYQVHGARDWMFPVAHARAAAAALKKAGAESIYHEIGDLSHNYPRDENEAIVRWFLAGE